MRTSSECSHSTIHKFPPTFAEKVNAETTSNSPQDAQTTSNNFKPSQTPAGQPPFPLFRTDKHPLEECQQQLREALLRANTKAEACRNIRQLTTLGYMNIDAYTDQQKAELINPYTQGRFRFKRKDFQRYK